MICVLACLASLVLVSKAAYVNEFDAPFTFQCQSHTQTISRVQSIHDNHKEDRRFDFTCREVLAESNGHSPSCYWTPNWVNDFDDPVHFSCQPSHYISGMRSEHNNHDEDRRWKFLCCSITNVHLSDCGFTGWTNNFDQVQDFILADNSVMAGVVSIHDNHKEDRRFEYEYCKVYQTDGSEIIG